jgi:protein-ribulosamine 3-kinase
MIPDFLKEEVGRALKNFTGHEPQIRDFLPVSGGCINNCFQVRTSHGNYFLKYNDANRYPKMFEAEASGLRLLHDAGAIKVPGVIAAGEVSSLSFLILEWIERGKAAKNFWTDFGSRLASLHRRTSEHFGLNHDNYIGSLAQSNRTSMSWINFFVQERLEPQLKSAIDSGVIGADTVQMAASLFKKLPALLPVEPPSLLHGDLWNGNFIGDEEGHAALIDPAVYYGHREMDLAMTKLFGGFDPEFYSAYHASFPLVKGFEDRIDIHNLYPLLVHVNLFGGSYISQVEKILKTFS